MNLGSMHQISPKLISLACLNKKIHLMLNNKTTINETIATDFNCKSYKVKVNNNIYNVKVNNDLDALIKDMGFEVGASKLVNEIKAPMHGLLLDIMVKKGQEVKIDDALLILEAMKMETESRAPRAGTSGSVSTKEG